MNTLGEEEELRRLAYAPTDTGAIGGFPLRQGNEGAGGERSEVFS